jgi:hypothetical protein
MDKAKSRKVPNSWAFPPSCRTTWRWATRRRGRLRGRVVKWELPRARCTEPRLTLRFHLGKWRAWSALSHRPPLPRVPPLTFGIMEALPFRPRHKGDAAAGAGARWQVRRRRLPRGRSSAGLGRCGRRHRRARHLRQIDRRNLGGSALGEVRSNLAILVGVAPPQPQLPQQWMDGHAHHSLAHAGGRACAAHRSTLPNRA